MKILFFSYAYPNLINPGLGTFNRTMIAGLAQEHDVRVMSPVPFTDVWRAKWTGRLPNGLNDSSFHALSNVRAHYCTWYYTPKFFRSQYGQFMRFSVGSRLKRAINDFQPDLVVSYWTHPDGEVAVNIAHECGVKAVAIVGGSDVLLNARQGTRRTAILNVLNAADGVVTVSDEIKQVLVNDGIAEKKLYLSRRGVDRRIFHEGNQSVARQMLGLVDDCPILISVGRLVDVKGHTHLIQACRLLADRGVRFRCYLLGEGPLRTALQQQIESQQLTEIVEIKGPQTQGVLADWYRAADLSVLASVSEGVPNVLLESIACGTPFVASKVGGIPEIADSVRDVLVPSANPSALAEAIQQQLTRNLDEVQPPRTYSPPTVQEAAEHLSRILRSVQTGRRSLLSDAAIMHETMSDYDLDTVQDGETAKLKKSSATATIADSAAESSRAPFRGRMGEGYESAALNSAKTLSISSIPTVSDSAISFARERELLKAAMEMIYRPSAKNEDCGRTAENYVRPNDVGSSASNPQPRGKANEILNDREAFKAAMAVAFRGNESEENCGRTAENYRISSVTKTNQVSNNESAKVPETHPGKPAS